MKITSKVTYVLPFLVLLIPSYYLSGLLYIALSFLPFLERNYGLSVIASIVFTLINVALFFLAFVKLATKVKPIVFKIILVAFPVVVGLFFHRSMPVFMSSILIGLLLLYAYTLFNTRYIATLTDTSIQYKNLLGHVGEIPLTTLTSLEQKKNILGMVTRYGRILNISRKTTVGFRDENLDEYEINLFVKVWNHNNIFEKIIHNSNRVGNLKVRQYTM
jgi:hypothetical protein